MRLYHYTSLDNLQKILETKKVKPMSIYNGKNVLWLTKDKVKHHQYWAVGDHRDKTEIRITLSTLNFSKLILPEEVAERQELFRLGAVNVNLWSEFWKCNEKEPNFNDMNWYISGSLHFPLMVKQFNKNQGKYVSVNTWTLEDQIEYMESLQGTKWYIRRWNKFYSEKYSIKLGGYVNGQINPC